MKRWHAISRYNSDAKQMPFIHSDLLIYTHAKVVPNFISGRRQAQGVQGIKVSSPRNNQHNGGEWVCQDNLHFENVLMICNLPFYCQKYTQIFVIKNVPCSDHFN